MDLVYVAGAPASGKSTLMATLTRGCIRTQRAKPLPHQVLIDPQSSMPMGCELGRYRPGFPGTDTLAMNIAPVAKQFVSQPFSFDLILGEGDRLGFPGFLEAAQQGGYTVTLVHTYAGLDVLDARCARRGSRQDLRWRTGRDTKAANLAKWAKAHGCRVISLDTSEAAPPLLASMLRDKIPALGRLPEA